MNIDTKNPINRGIHVFLAVILAASMLSLASCAEVKDGAGSYNAATADVELDSDLMPYAGGGSVPTAGAIVYFGHYPQSYSGTTRPTVGREGVDWVSQKVSYYDKKASYHTLFGDPPDNTTAYFNIEPIAWRVLSNSGGKLFLLARDALDGGQYNAKQVYPMNWSVSGIRSWLNGNSAEYTTDSFVSRAFTLREEMAVSETLIPKGTHGGTNTKDKVFLLSMEEMSNAAYGFDSTPGNSDVARRAQTTSFARARSAYAETSSAYLKNGNVIARERGIFAYFFAAAAARYDGQIFSSAIYVDNPSASIRPAINLDMASVTLTQSGGGEWTAAVPASPYAGDTVYFGRYPQSLIGTTPPATGTKDTDWVEQAANLYDGRYTQMFGDPEVGATAYYSVDLIGWRVLGYRNGKILLISQNALDCKPYHVDEEAISWDASTIRSWLNGYGASANAGGNSGISYTADNFIGKAFTAGERNAITTTSITTPKNPSSGVSGGNATKDKLFLLSLQDTVNTSYGFSGGYDDNDAARCAQPTPFARAHGSWVASTENVGNTPWWLRSPGQRVDNEAYVLTTGLADRLGQRVTEPYSSVRPSLNMDVASVTMRESGNGEWVAAAQDSPHVHCWGDWETVLQPTLTAEGRKERTCSACGAKESKTLPKLEPPAPETGDTVYFGRYPQALLGTSTPAGVNGVDWAPQTVGLKDSGYVAEFGDPPSGTTAYYKLEPIAWRVLQRTGNKIYMMAESAIDAKPYHADLEDVTWKTSTIRSWLNGYGKSSNTGGSGGIDYTSDNFIGKAFTPDERNAVTAVAVENPNNGAMEPPVPGGGRTHDKVFLLSLSDSTNAGFGFKPNAGDGDAARTALATPFARARGATVVRSSPFRNKAWPWLRYPGRNSRNAAFVTADGKSDYGGQDVNAKSFAVRPVLNLDKASVSISVSGGGVWTVATPDAPVHEHVWGPWVTVLQPTQTAEGREERTCLVCGEKGSRAIAKLPHTHAWGPWTVVLPPTYTSDGWEERACSVCGEKEGRVVAMLPHEHAWGEWTVVIEPTLTSEGSKERECSVCGEKEFQTVPKLDPPPHVHTWGSWVVVVPPTQTSEGMEERTCTTCGEHESRAIAKLDPVPHEHSWGSWTVISPATEEAEGIEERVCTVCGERERRYIPKLPPTDPPTGPSIDPPVDPPTGPSIDPPVGPPTGPSIDPPTGPSTETPDKPTAPTSIASAAMAVAAEAQWTGAQIKPYIALTLNGRALVQGEDFAAGYGTNTDIGIGYVSISGQGRYTGMKTAYFNIVPKMVKVKKVKPGKRSAKVTWAKAAAAQKITGYEIRYKMKGKAAWKAKKAKAKAKSFTIKKLKKGKAYQIRIRAYKKIGARVYRSPWSKVKKSKKIR